MKHPWPMGLVAAFVLAACGPVETDEDDGLCSEEAKVAPCDVDKHGPEWCFLTSHCRRTK